MDFLTAKIKKIQYEINNLNDFLEIYNNDIKEEVDSKSVLNDKIPNEIKNKLKDEINSNTKTEGKLLWSELSDESPDEIIKEEDIINEINKIKEELLKINTDLNKIKYYLKPKISKIIRFTFNNHIITWKLKEEHKENNLTRIILNPIKGNIDIIQIFHYDHENNLLGFQLKDKIIWYVIDNTERLIIYKDNQNKDKYVYYKFVAKEKIYKETKIKNHRITDQQCKG